MLDIGWTEILVITVIALFVVGPKDIPKGIDTKTGCLAVNKFRKCILYCDTNTDCGKDALCNKLDESNGICTYNFPKWGQK